MPCAGRDRHGLMRTGADALLFVRGLVPEVVPIFRSEIHPALRQREQRNNRPARHSGNQPVSDPMIRNISYPIRKARRAFGMWLWFCRSCAQETFGQRLDDERTRSNSGLKIPFCMKPREREVDGEP